MGAIDNKMNIMANFLRINCGRNSVEKVQDHLSARNKKLDDMFDIKYVKQSEYTTTGEVEEGKSNKKRKKEVKEVDLPVVYAKNVEELASLIMVERMTFIILLAQYLHFLSKIGHLGLGI